MTISPNSQYIYQHMLGIHKKIDFTFGGIDIQEFTIKHRNNSYNNELFSLYFYYNAIKNMNIYRSIWWYNIPVQLKWEITWIFSFTFLKKILKQDMPSQGKVESLSLLKQSEESYFPATQNQKPFTFPIRIDDSSKQR